MEVIKREEYGIRIRPRRCWGRWGRRRRRGWFRQKVSEKRHGRRGGEGESKWDRTFRRRRWLGGRGIPRRPDWAIQWVSYPPWFSERLIRCRVGKRRGEARMRDAKCECDRWEYKGGDEAMGESVANFRIRTFASGVLSGELNR